MIAFSRYQIFPLLNKQSLDRYLAVPIEPQRAANIMITKSKVSIYLDGLLQFGMSQPIDIVSPKGVLIVPMFNSIGVAGLAGKPPAPAH
jgi:hypothetical protein